MVATVSAWLCTASGSKIGARLDARLVGPGEIALLVLQQHLGDAGVARGYRRHHDEGDEARGERRDDDPPFAPPQRAPQAHEVDGFAALRRRVAVLESIAVHPPLRSVNAPELASFMRD